MLVFRKIWRALFIWNTRSEIRPFALLPTNYILITYIMIINGRFRTILEFTCSNVYYFLLIYSKITMITVSIWREVEISPMQRVIIINDYNDYEWLLEMTEANLLFPMNCNFVSVFGNNLHLKMKRNTEAALQRCSIRRCSESMQQIYRRTLMPKCDFNKVAKQLYWSHTSAWVFSCKFAAYFQNTFS